MTLKKFFDQQKSQDKSLKGILSGSIQEIGQNVESEFYINEFNEGKFSFIPDVNYSDPKNFAKYGSAKKYYEDAIKRIYNQYPYDGSRAEQLEFTNNLTPLEKYILNERYPKTNGYVTIGETWGSQATSSNGYGEPATHEYIIFYGGPHVDNKFNATIGQESNLKIDGDIGNTVEFWLNKSGAFDPFGATQKEVIFDLWNNESNTSASYGRLTIEMDALATPVFKVTYQSGSTGVFNATIGSNDLDSSGVADSEWKHYAFTFQNTGSQLELKLYINGLCNDTAITGTAVGLVSSNISAVIGSLISAPSGTTAPELGWGKCRVCKFDEFRFWKTKRNSKQINLNLFTQVGGGTNTDTSKYTEDTPVDLGVYFKFNEGIVGDSTTDQVVLDYSGRVSNGVFIGYATGSSRNTGSAFVESGVADFEELNPIIYRTHPDVVSLNTELASSGSNYDIINNSSLNNMIPQWVREEEEAANGELSNLLQILSSYLDTLYGQVSEINKLKEVKYSTGSIKQFPHNERLLSSLGFDIPELFTQSDLIEEIFLQNDKKVFEEQLYNLKNLIYKNIYNNLSFINKSKGTEKSFRNLFRCFGVDDELFKINIYGDNIEYTIEDNFENVSIKKNLLDFSGIKDSTNREGTAYQLRINPSDSGYIVSSSNVNIPLTIEAEVIFPKIPELATYFGLDILTTSSVLGCRSATNHDDLDIPAIDRNFNIYAIKEDNDRTYFMLTSSNNALPELTSSAFLDVYDNSKWNFAVRIKPENYPFSSEVTSSTQFIVEFYGTNIDLGHVVEEFSVSSSISLTTANNFLTGSNKRLFIGAERQNITGAIVHKSDVRFSNLRVWNDYVTDDEIQFHARNPDNIGRLNPLNNSFIFEGNVGNVFIPKMETLALNWDFSDVTTSDVLGQFEIKDISSGSLALQDRYTENNIGTIIKANHSGLGNLFTANSEDVRVVDFISAQRQIQPENLYSTNLTNILDSDDSFFTRETRPQKHFFSIESSMYEVISRNILNYFASVVDFNNLIGEPVYKYRTNYKNLEKLRNLFFEKIENVATVDRYANLYKWIDNALDSIIANMLPASANASEEVRTIVESHVLERNKHAHKLSLFNEFAFDESTKQASEINTQIYTKDVDLDDDDRPTFDPTQVEEIFEPTYPATHEDIKTIGIKNNGGLGELSEYKQSFASLTQEQSENPAWWKFRAERDRGSLLSPSINSNTTRAQVHSNVVNEIERNRYVPVEFSTEKQDILAVGVNHGDQKIVDYYKNTLTENDFVGGLPVDGITINFNTGTLNLAGEPYEDISTEIEENKIVPIVAFDSRDSNNKYEQERLPFDLISSSLATGYQSQFNNDLALNVAFEDMHFDEYGDTSEIAMQGPFTEKNVGGNQYRHNNLFATGSDRIEGYAINIFTGSNTIKLNHPRVINDVYDPTKPNGVYYRDFAAKSFVNIKNILNENYDKDYQVISTNDNDINNNLLLEGGLNTIEQSDSTTVFWRTGVPVVEYSLPDRENTGSNEYIFENRFSAVGGPECESEGFLDIESAQYSPYNTLNYRNLIARKLLNELYSRNTDDQGFDGLFGPPFPSFHGVENNKKHVVSLQNSSSFEIEFDNLFISHQIPRTDLGYNWIKEAWIAEIQDNNVLISSFFTEDSQKYPVLGFECSEEFLTFLSKSEAGVTVGSEFRKADFVGTNFAIYAKVDEELNLLTSSYYFVNEDAAEATVLQEIGQVLNAYLHNYNGPYHYPTWKQLRTYEHPVVIDQKNKLEHQSIINNNIRRFKQSDVTNKYKDLNHIVEKDSKINELQYSFGNQLHHYCQFYDVTDNKLNSFGREFGVYKDVRKNTFFILKSNGYNTKYLRYGETIFPRDENIFREKTFDRPNYDSFWNENIEDRVEVRTNSQGFSQNMSSWPMDVIYSRDGIDIPGTSSCLSIDDNSGELVRVDTFDRLVELCSAHPTTSLPPQGNVAHARIGRFYGGCLPDNLVQTQAGRGAFYNNYEDFIYNAHLLGQGYSLISEFTISDFVSDIVRNSGSNFYSDVYNFTLTGSDVTITNNEFLETYSHTDTITHISDISNVSAPRTIKLKMSAVKKLLPKEGFYPVQRTVQLAQQFSQSYGPNTTLAGTQTTFRTALAPFYSPGIMYNSIKSGVGVSYPVLNNASINRNSLTASLCDVAARNYEINSTLPFESIIEPATYYTKLSASLDDTFTLYDFDKNIVVDCTATLPNISDGVYELMAHNFFAEEMNFFLDKVTNISSLTENEWFFDGPLSSSAGIKKFSLNVELIKSGDSFSICDNPEYFGQYPYFHHLPPYYTVGADADLVCTYPNISSSCAIITPLETRGQNKAIAKITFDPTNILSRFPEKFSTGKFTLDDIVNNITIEYSNQNLTTITASVIGQVLSSSVNMFYKTKDNRLSIHTKWETPIFNFADVEATSDEGELSGFGGDVGDPTRMIWSQYGEFVNDNEGLFLRVTEPNLSDVELRLTGSLTKACGFSPEPIRIGEVAQQKEIKEAIIAVPFFIDECGKENFYFLDLDKVEDSWSKYVRKDNLDRNIILDQINKMNKYVLPPQYDWVKVRSKSNKQLLNSIDYLPALPPFAMYIFEFSTILSREDLRKIWQGVMPDISVTEEFESIEIKHDLNDGFITKLRDDTRWKIFKVKLKAENNYYDFIESKTNAILGEKRNNEFSFNWPYDFFSLAELGKLEIEIEAEEKENK